MNSNPNEPGKIFGIAVKQPKNVQKAFEVWLKKTHPHHKVVDYAFVAALSGCFVAALYNVHRDLAINIGIITFLIMLLYVMHTGKQYDKQAPKNLKRR